jgi:catechol 2,3-dioxygenase-like lactoylglutathione lyase family enzyme
MAGSPRGIGAITLFVDDVRRSKAWYQAVFDQPIVFEDGESAAFKFDNMVVNLLAISAAHPLIAPAAVATRQVGSHAQLTIWVADVDTECADLQRRGVTLLNGPMDREWGQRTACFADPDGHIWELAQSL